MSDHCHMSITIAFVLNFNTYCCFAVLFKLSEPTPNWRSKECSIWFASILRLQEMGRRPSKQWSGENITWKASDEIQKIPLLCTQFRNFPFLPWALWCLAGRPGRSCKNGTRNERQSLSASCHGKWIKWPWLPVLQTVSCHRDLTCPSLWFNIRCLFGTYI